MFHGVPCLPAERISHLGLVFYASAAASTVVTVSPWSSPCSMCTKCSADADDIGAGGTLNPSVVSALRWLVSLDRQPENYIAVDT